MKKQKNRFVNAWDFLRHLVGKKEIWHEARVYYNSRVQLNVCALSAKLGQNSRANANL